MGHRLIGRYTCNEMQQAAVTASFTKQVLMYFLCGISREERNQVRGMYCRRHTQDIRYMLCSARGLDHRSIRLPRQSHWCGDDVRKASCGSSVEEQTWSKACANGSREFMTCIMKCKRVVRMQRRSMQQRLRIGSLVQDMLSATRARVFRRNSVYRSYRHPELRATFAMSRLGGLHKLRACGVEPAKR